MGVTGAALATVISQLVSAVWVLRFLFGPKAVVRIGRRDLFRFDLPLIRESVTLGLSGFIMSATTGATQAVCNATLSLYGGDLYIGVMTIINSVREMITLPVNALTSGSQPSSAITTARRKTGGSGRASASRRWRALSTRCWRGR